MMRLIKKLSSWRIVPAGWTLLTIVLLCLPGSAIPSSGVFSIEGIDKVVHITLFGGIVLLWGFNLYFRREQIQKWRKTVLLLAVFSIALGIGLEFLQRDYIPNRSFDGYDIIADSIGAVVAGLLHLVLKIK